MTNDPKFAGGGYEYGAPQPEAYAPQPVMRPAPQGFVAQPAAVAAAPPPAQQYTHATQPYVPPPVVAATPAISAAAAAAASGAPLVEDDPVILSKPYFAHGEPVTELRFRKPTGADAVRCGYPFRMVQSDGGEVEYKVIPESVSKLITALSIPPIPRSTVDALDIKDWNACSSRINSFFLG